MQTGQTLTTATSAYLLENLPQDSTLYTVFSETSQIDATIITPAVQALVAAYQAKDPVGCSSTNQNHRRRSPRSNYKPRQLPVAYR